MISYEHKCIFVHIPKTGGTSIEKIIWPSEGDYVEDNLCMGLIDSYHNKYQTGGLQHLLASQIHQEVDSGYFRDFFKFTLVRNPWEKAVSQFMYMKKRKDLREFAGMREDSSFKEYLSLIKKKNHVQWDHQHRFFLDENGDQLVDYIGRFEVFQDDVASILEKINLADSEIPHLNKSTRAHYKHYFDEETTEMICDLYETDIDLLGYNF